mmetsp:Transcript_5776/g.17055  ORF Transcript_5776/g.17055 Transcript_5776/m.17055 type:complete len:171 (+) Transcript_5776:179-691(+)
MRRAAWLLTVACASTARRRLKKTARVPSPTGPVSDDVARLRKTTRTPCDLSIEPEGSLLVFTAQRSGSRWFVDTLGARSGGKITSKMFEMSIHPGRLGNRYLSWAKDHAACESGKVSKLCSCALAEAFRGEVSRPWGLFVSCAFPRPAPNVLGGGRGSPLDARRGRAPGG